MSDASSQHKSLKQQSYWDTLVTRETHRYRTEIIVRLLEEHLSIPCARILDVGAGTDSSALYIKQLFNAQEVICVDYDEKKVREMKEQLPEASWVVADILDPSITQLGPQSLILLQDMLHEVYSFYGRANQDVSLPIDHELGASYAVRSLTNLTKMLEKGGGLVITDNVVPSSKETVTVRVKNDAALQAVKSLINDYPSRKLGANWIEADTFTIPSHDFAILLTQYNKVKRGDKTRYVVERLEIHQYFTLEEYRDLFQKLGCEMHAVTGTPEDAKAEWEEDFEVLEGLNRKLPDKRITLLAIKS